MFAVIGLPVGLPAWAVIDDFVLVRQTIDGGGGRATSTGGNLALSGTIGQPDSGRIANGDYQLAGGFWIPIPAGDCEADGDVDLLDHREFSTCVTGPLPGQIDPSCRCFDVNRSGMVDLADFAIIQDTHTGS
ncbi:MAG: hypothetical protein ACE5EX_03430 [Phycisphaerae bacterium]